MNTFTRTGYQRLNKSLSDNTTSGRTKVALENKCRICGWKPPYRHGVLTRHHLVPHAWFMKRKHELRVLRNSNANIVPLCRECHDAIDNSRDPVHRLQNRSTLRWKLYPEEIAFILQVKGRDWFDRHYPRNP